MAEPDPFGAFLDGQLQRAEEDRRQESFELDQQIRQDELARRRRRDPLEENALREQLRGARQTNEFNEQTFDDRVTQTQQQTEINSVRLETLGIELQSAALNLEALPGDLKRRIETQEANLRKLEQDIIAAERENDPRAVEMRERAARIAMEYQEAQTEATLALGRLRDAQATAEGQGAGTGVNLNNIGQGGTPNAPGTPAEALDGLTDAGSAPPAVVSGLQALSALSSEPGYATTSQLSDIVAAANQALDSGLTAEAFTVLDSINNNPLLAGQIQTEAPDLLNQLGSAAQFDSRAQDFTDLPPEERARLRRETGQGAQQTAPERASQVNTRINNVAGFTF